MRHATQGTLANRPLRKTAIQNGRDVARFDGILNHIENTAPSLATTAATICVVAKSVKLNSCFLSLGPNTTNQGFGISRHTDGTFKAYVFGGTESYRPGSSNFIVGSAVVGGGQHFVVVNGGEKSTLASAASLSIGTGYTAGALRAGGFTPDLEGDIAEILVFPTALSDTDRTKVETYLNGKWAIY